MITFLEFIKTLFDEMFLGNLENLRKDEIRKNFADSAIINFYEVKAKDYDISYRKKYIDYIKNKVLITIQPKAESTTWYILEIACDQFEDFISLDIIYIPYAKKEDIKTLTSIFLATTTNVKYRDAYFDESLKFNGVCQSLSGKRKGFKGKLINLLLGMPNLFCSKVKEKEHQDEQKEFEANYQYGDYSSYVESHLDD